jgi:hypothetical protein
MDAREKMNPSRFASPWASTAHINVIGEYLAMPSCSEVHWLIRYHFYLIKASLEIGVIEKATVLGFVLEY